LSLKLILTLNHRRIGSFQEPPPDMESIMSPATLAAYPSAAAAVDAVVADDLLRQALRVRQGALPQSTIHNLNYKPQS